MSGGCQRDLCIFRWRWLWVISAILLRTSTSDNSLQAILLVWLQISMRLFVLFSTAINEWQQQQQNLTFFFAVVSACDDAWSTKLIIMNQRPGNGLMSYHHIWMFVHSHNLYKMHWTFSETSQQTQSPCSSIYLLIPVIYLAYHSNCLCEFRNRFMFIYPRIIRKYQ